MNRYVLFLLLLLSVAGACRKPIDPDMLQGTWIEQEGENSKLVFKQDTFFFFHDPEIDTSFYSLDEKHSAMWTFPVDSSHGGHNYQLEWHKRKEILVVIGLFPSGLGNSSKNYFKKQ